MQNNAKILQRPQYVVSIFCYFLFSVETFYTGHLHNTNTEGR